jgi:hypothetical protein
MNWRSGNDSLKVSADLIAKQVLITINGREGSVKERLGQKYFATASTQRQSSLLP